LPQLLRAPETPPIALVSAACQVELAHSDQAAAREIVRLRPYDDRLAVLGRAHRKVVATLRARKHTLDVKQKQLHVYLAKSNRAATAVTDFNRAHPQASLAPPLYARWQQLHARYLKAHSAYHRFYPHYATAYSVYDRAYKAFRRSLARYEKQASTVERLARGADSSTLAYERTLAGCSGPPAQIAGHERARIGSLEGELAAAVQGVATRDVSVSCDPKSQWPESIGTVSQDEIALGYVVPGVPVIHLSPSTCYALHAHRYLLHKVDLACLDRSYQKGEPLCSPAAADFAEATVTLTHEAVHVAGEIDEAKTECFAVQKAPAVAQTLGVSAQRAFELAWYVWRFPTTPANYQSSDCKAKGRYDLAPASARFP
jgi:hypothetical protein